jgi:Aerotolerance regulator N-terminal/von Willebrand factor type A domain
VNFLNLALLGGVAAFLVPLAIHLLNRSRHQTIQWGAMHLLEAAIQVNSRRFQWESLLLLILRCLIPILFAIGLARPVLTALQSSSAQGQSSVVIMLDNSLSMQASDRLAPEQSRFQLAAGETRKLLSQQQRSDISVWSLGGGPLNVVNGSTFDAAFAARSLDKIQVGAGPCDPIAAIDAGVEQLAKMSNPNKQLIIASDFQASQWGTLSAEQLQRLKELLSSGTLPIQLSLLPASKAEKNDARNLSVELSAESRESQLEPIFLNDTVRVIASIQNWDNQPVASLNVSFRVNEVALASESIDLQPNSQQQIQFNCSFKAAGKHSYSVQIKPTAEVDAISGDNVTTGVISVREPIRVVIVDPASANSLDSSGKLLQLALSPDSTASGFQVQLLSRMPPSEDLKNCEVLVAVGSGFDDEMSRRIVDFVSRGGGLLHLPDDGMDWNRVNRLWFEQIRLLPARYAERKTNASEPPKLKQLFFQDQSLSIFNSPEHGDLTSVQAQQWHRLDKDTDAATSGSSTGLLQLADSDNTLVLAKRSMGKGTALQWGFTPSSKWSNLSTKSVFVPLVQRLVFELAGEETQLPHQLLTGYSLSLSESQMKQAVSSSSSDATSTTQEAWHLIDPQTNKLSSIEADADVPSSTSSQSQENKASTRPTINFPPLRWPGVYRIGSPQGSTQPESSPILCAVAVPREESDPNLLSDSQLEQLSKQLGASVVRSADNYRAVQQIRRDGKEIWRPLLILLVVFLFAEILLARRVTRGA